MVHLLRSAFHVGSGVLIARFLFLHCLPLRVLSFMKV